MSFVTDQVRRIDAHLDRYQPRIAARVRTQQQSIEVHGGVSRRVELLESLIKTVTNATSSRTILPTSQLSSIVTQAADTESSSAASTSASEEEEEIGEEGQYGRELEWLLVSKVAAQVQGRLLNRLLDEIMPVMDDIYYWDGVLGSYNYSALYMVQLFPLQLWKQGKEAVRDARENLQALRERGLASASGIAQEWRQFYGLVRDSIQERRLNSIQSRLFSPVIAARMDARSRLQGLNRQKQICAAAIGLLTNESLNVQRVSRSRADVALVSSKEWRSHVVESVELMSTAMSQVSSLDNTDLQTYESLVLASRSEITYQSIGFQQAYRKLEILLRTTLPQHEDEYREQRLHFGRPSRWIRYWLPASIGLLSSTTLLRILVNRRADILTWIQDFGKTTMAFWENWVVGPVRDIVRTIRHDKDSEIALMSRESLESDRASLERMVVDFAVENPETAGGPPLDDALVAQIRDKVKEGDLTPVLRAYEHDLKKPFARAVTGNLVRELLIQIQKTKVDVEVAMSGIDSLLKSQELVFGLVGLTPGILVCVLLGRWMSELLGGRKGKSQGRLQGRLIRVIRNIDRILSNAEPQDNGLLTYRDHGLILCEVQTLQANSARVLPGEINKEFLEDLKDLTDMHLGIERHIKVVDRLRWAYWKWLN